MKYIFLLASLSLASIYVSAAPLLDTIKDTKELNTLNSIITASKNLTTLFGSVKDFTFLAPSNNALERWFAKGDGSNNAALLETKLLRYHLLHGRITTQDFTTTPQFLHSFMNDSSYANVTGGQVVELVKKDGQPIILSGNKTVSTIATPADRIASGGYLQIIEEVLEMPLNLIDSLSQFGTLTPFIAVLNAGGFVDQNESPLIKQLLRASDITCFAPNTQDALKAMNTAAKGMTEQQRSSIFGYHLVPTLTFSSDLKDGMKLKTLQGGELTVTILDGQTYINSAKLLTTNYLIGNGVIHTIDNLLDSTSPNPPEKSPIPIPGDTQTEKPKSQLATEAKVGIAIGVIALIGLLLALGFMLNRRRRIIRQQMGREEDETTRVVDGKDFNQQEYLAHGPTDYDGGNVNRVRLHPDEIELEAKSSSNSLTASQRKWEYEVNAVELDGTGGRHR